MNYRLKRRIYAQLYKWSTVNEHHSLIVTIASCILVVRLCCIFQLLFYFAQGNPLVFQCLHWYINVNIRNSYNITTQTISTSPGRTGETLNDNLIRCFKNDILLFAAVGCADMPTPKGGWIKRRGDRLTIACNGTGETRHLVCSGTRWIGEVRNCSSGELSYLILCIIYTI